VFLAEPRDLLPDGLHDVCLRPVDSKGLGSTGRLFDRKRKYWKAFFRESGVRDDLYCTTTVDRRRINWYFNAGSVSWRRASGFAARWMEQLEQVMAMDILPAGHRNNADQVSLSLAASAIHPRVRFLDCRYNYPVPKRPLMEGSARNLRLNQLVRVHYDEWFQKRVFFSDHSAVRSGR
jgi:hypothetical protein